MSSKSLCNFKINHQVKYEAFENMSILETSRKTVKPLSIRVWHWFNVIAIGGLLITVLINATLTGKKIVKPLIINESGKNGVVINEKQAADITHALSDKTWNVHVYFGYILTALLAFRLLAEFFRLRNQKNIRGVKQAYTQFKTEKKERKTMLHKLFIKAAYTLFYITIIIMVTTGLSLAFKFDFLQSLRHSIKQVHGFCMYVILGFIIVHTAGVIRAEHTLGKGIVSDMINGGNK